jgi:hypothetical protein
MVHRCTLEDVTEKDKGEPKQRTPAGAGIPIPQARRLLQEPQEGRAQAGDAYRELERLSALLG